MSVPKADREAVPELIRPINVVRSTSSLSSCRSHCYICRMRPGHLAATALTLSYTVGIAAPACLADAGLWAALRALWRPRVLGNARVVGRGAATRLETARAHSVLFRWRGIGRWHFGILFSSMT
jgi:hypothetical protein